MTKQEEQWRQESILLAQLRSLPNKQSGSTSLSKERKEAAIRASHYQGEPPLWYLKAFFKSLAIKAVIWIRWRFNV